MDKYIEILESKIEKIDSPTFEKACHIFMLIQFKNRGEYRALQETLYIDIKKFIDVYIKSVEYRKNGYDILQVDKIIKAIEYSNSVEKQYLLFQFAFRKLKIEYFDEEANIIQKHLNKSKYKYLNIKGLKVDAFLFKWSYDIKPLLGMIGFLIIITNILFLPAPIEGLEVFNISYVNFHSDFVLNHISNTLAFIAGQDRALGVEPFSLYGVILLIIIRLSFILFIGNFLIEKIKTVGNI
ncbi:hypothetical protein GCM10007103_03460 [Salinimicrobium marinum]|uniref:Uncharacterized protein n=1 Tax=Salinimicrobium marinum TaxID=680283 RepID=A0A918S821_9FLAO|nr:hypothetical protein [Salinimicrobium marinum]GHA25536.1 hypothetical protein GCM10007103_03460 [Salinimicrobium marinum]